MRLRFFTVRERNYQREGGGRNESCAVGIMIIHTHAYVQTHTDIDMCVHKSIS